MKKMALSCLVMATTFGCSVKDDMDSMHDSTVEMNETTQEMRDVTARMERKTGEMQQTTAAMAKTTDHMAEDMQMMLKTTKGMAATTEALNTTSTNTYQDLRHGNSADMRLTALEKMKGAGSQAEKITYAAQFVRAFDFQLWKAQGRDNEAKLQEQRLDAVNEFMRIVKGICMELGGKLTTSPLSNDLRMQDLYALATVLHMVDTSDPKVLNYVGDGVQQLLLAGLRNKRAVDAGTIRIEDLPAYQQSVLGFEKYAIFMLKLRQNFIAAMAVSEISEREIGEPSTLSRLKMLVLPWNSHTEAHNLVRLKFFVDFFDEVLETQSMLRELGHDGRLDGKLLRVLKNLRIEEVSVESTTRSQELDALRDRIKKIVSVD
jgi:hypothetical protein